MAQGSLVDWDINSGALVLDALAAENIPIEHAFWSADLEESGAWTLHIVTPLYDEIGPIKTLERVEEAIQKGGLPDRVRASLHVSGPQGMSARTKSELSFAATTASPSVSGAYVPSVVPYIGGTVTIVLENPQEPYPHFRVTFSPYGRPGGVMRPEHLNGTVNLTVFLMEKLGIETYIAREAVVRAALTGRWSIPNVNISEDRLKLHGLAA